ncbi:hypothetical protein IAT38_005513 [Cryptococcus sp. DSM 104549]
MTTLHPDILYHTLSHLPPSSLASSIRVSKDFYQLSAAHLYTSLTLDLNTCPSTHTLLQPLPEPTHPSTCWPRPPHTYIRHLTIPHHTDASPCHHLPPNPTLSALPALHTLHLTIHPRSPVGWAYCKPADTARYPVYPATRMCPLLTHLRPTRLAISDTRMLVSPSIFPPASPMWERVREVVVRIQTGGGMWSMDCGGKGFWDQVPKGVRRVVLLLDGEALPFEEEKVVRDVRAHVASLALRGCRVLVVGLSGGEGVEGGEGVRAEGRVWEGIDCNEGGGEIKFMGMKEWIREGEWEGVYSEEEIKRIEQM